MSGNSPDIEWRDGVPVSTQFDDPYYSVDGGLAESRFVFLDGIDLPQLAHAASDQPVIIAETGFGTGLNFLATWQWWRKHAPNKRLIFISAEAFPLDAQQLKRAHSHFPELSDLGSILVDAWPPQAQGYHPVDFDGGTVKLLLMFDDAATAFAELSGTVDAWYLDGFAPARNPDMWTETLFSEMAKHSQPGAKIATFTAAGFVRRGLTDAGFIVRKAQGFGRKRERLLGEFNPISCAENSHGTRALNWATTRSRQNAKTVTIIGGGVAGASAAHALTQRGMKVTIIEAAHAPSSSGLPAAILVPRFMLQDQPERRFFNSAFAHAVSHKAYRPSFGSKRGAWVLSKSREDAERLAKVSESYGWSAGWMEWHEGELHLPKSGTVQPETVLKQLTEGSNHVKTAVTAIVQLQDGDGWQVEVDGKTERLESDILIVASGPKSTELLSLIDRNSQGHPKLRANLGQLLLVDSRDTSDWSQSTMSFGGYISASTQKTVGKSFRAIGSTFDKLDDCPEVTPAPTDGARDSILEQLKSIETISSIPVSATVRDWTGIRATVPDHLPYCGPIPDWSSLENACQPLVADANQELAHEVSYRNGLYCLTGLGSKGYQYGPLLGEYLAAMICGEPLPIPKSLIAKLHPARSMVKSLIRTNR